MDALLVQTPSQLSPQLKSLRKSRKLTQGDVAARLRVTQERYSKMERNPERIATGQLLEVLAALGVDVLLRLRAPESAPTPTRNAEDW